jgi:hypothetical protein
MSSQLAAPDGSLERLGEAGRRFALRDNHLVMVVPYLNAAGELCRGYIADPLNITNGTVIGLPRNHQVYFIGDDPCDIEGHSLLDVLGGGANRTLIFGENYSSYYYSHKLQENGVNRDYRSLFEKFEQYYRVIARPATYLHEDAEGEFLNVNFEADMESPFKFPDAHSAHAELHELNQALSRLRIGIVGVGGTGAYVLDFLAKTPVKSITLFDDDDYVIKNSFRSPGSTTEGDFKKAKVDLYVERYSTFRMGIRGEKARITFENPGSIGQCDFVFVCVDKGASREAIVRLLIGLNKPFIDVGMGLNRSAGAINGRVRATLVDEASRAVVAAEDILPVTNDDDDIYQTNIQIAELNALNGALAVILFKKRFGFYVDTEPGYNLLLNLDRLKIFKQVMQ